ncbi:MAG: hypothetical protein H0T70_06375 [Acidimicrobiia bacterium]|nr:hypothetical protein [Acidimicrobiia bacterium]
MSDPVPDPVRPPDREWISFEDDEEDRTWVFDITFLLSGWTCIFGQGCQGVLTAPAPELVQGCCSYGAHFTDADDVARVEAAAATLDASQWQFRRQGRSRGVTRTTAQGETVTRLVQDACVFLNRPGFEGGPGCALHRAALDRDERPMDLKPDVCWQLPLRREDHTDADGHVTSRLSEWGRRNWGGGGAEFHWWCTEAPEAFVGREPVYVTMADELEAMVGQATYRRLTSWLEARRVDRRTAPLPHPTVRTAGHRRPAPPG